MSAIETTEMSQSAYWVICYGMKTTLLLKFKDKKWSSQRENNIPSGPPASPSPDDAAPFPVSALTSREASNFYMQQLFGI